jgi:hypothetical protein
VSKNSSVWLVSVIGIPAALQPGCQKLMRSEEEGAALRLSGVPANPGPASGLPRVRAGPSNLSLRPSIGALPVLQSPLSEENEQLAPWIDPTSAQSAPSVFPDPPLKVFESPVGGCREHHLQDSRPSVVEP